MSDLRNTLGEETTEGNEGGGVVRVVRSVLLFLVMGVSLDTALCGAVCKDNACRSASNASVELGSYRK